MPKVTEMVRTKTRKSKITMSDDYVFCEHHPKTRSLRALTEAQGHYMLSIQSNTLTFGVGPAGTGKTLVAVGMAAEAFAKKDIERIVVTRPVVEAGNSLGFTPGDLDEKYSHYIAPVYDVLTKYLGKTQTDYAMKVGHIQAIPLEKMRGYSLNDTWVILDEAQNTTKTQMKMFLTRIGRNCKAIVNGDIDQCDLRCESGLKDAVDRFGGMADTAIIEFDMDDIVRSGIVREILMRYSG